MSSDSPTTGVLAKLKYSWQMMWRAVLHLWVRSKILPNPFDDIVIESDKPVCYVLDTYAFSSLLILDKCCEQLKLPRPVSPLKLDGVTRHVPPVQADLGIPAAQDRVLPERPPQEVDGSPE